MFLDRYMEDLAMDFSGYDDCHAGALLAEHLWEKGHRTICIPLSSAELSLSTTRGRLEGFKSVLSKIYRH